MKSGGREERNPHLQGSPNPGLSLPPRKSAKELLLDSPPILSMFYMHITPQETFFVKYVGKPVVTCPTAAPQES